MIVFVILDIICRIKDHALSAVLSYKEIRVGLKVSVRVRDLAVCYYRVELAVRAEAYVIATCRRPPIAEAARKYRAGILFNEKSCCELVTVAYIKHVSVAHIPKACRSGRCVHRNAERVEIAEYIFRAGLGAFNAVLYRCDSHI